MTIKEKIEKAIRGLFVDGGRDSATGEESWGVPEKVDEIIKLFIDELPETELEVGGAGGWICEGKLRYRQEIINKYKK